MAFSCGFYNSINHDRVYDAVQFGEMFDGLITDGIYSTIGNCFAVTTGAGLQVIVKSGRAWFNKTWSVNTSDLPIDLEMANLLLPRIDAIVLEIDTRVSVRNNCIKSVSGVPGVNPAKPILANGDGLYQYPLAYVTIPQNSSQVQASAIENAVGNVTPFVTGILTSVSIADLWGQWKGQFDEWFAMVQSQLEGDVAANLQKQINQKLDISDKATIADIASNSNDKWVTPALLDIAIEEKARSVGDIRISGSNLEKESSYMNCDGRFLSRTAYPELFSKIGYSYGQAPKSITKLDQVQTLYQTLYSTYPTLTSVSANANYMLGAFCLRTTIYLVTFNRITKANTFTSLLVKAETSTADAARECAIVINGNYYYIIASFGTPNLSTTSGQYYKTTCIYRGTVGQSVANATKIWQAGSDVGDSFATIKDCGSVGDLVFFVCGYGIITITNGSNVKYTIMNSGLALNSTFCFTFGDIVYGFYNDSVYKWDLINPSATAVQVTDPELVRIANHLLTSPSESYRKVYNSDRTKLLITATISNRYSARSTGMVHYIELTSNGIKTKSWTPDLGYSAPNRMSNAIQMVGYFSHDDEPALAMCGSYLNNNIYDETTSGNNSYMGYFAVFKDGIWRASQSFVGGLMYEILNTRHSTIRLGSSGFIGFITLGTIPTASASTRVYTYAADMNPEYFGLPYYGMTINQESDHYIKVR